MHKKTRSVKDLEKAVEKYESKIKELTDAHRDDGVIPFDKLGVDHLFIDEADIYKNLEYYTQLQNVRGLGTPKGSERTIDILMKIRYVQSIAGAIKESHSVVLPPSIVATIDAGLASGRLKPDVAHDLICNVIGTATKQGFSWKEKNNPPGVHSAFVVDVGKIAKNDIVIKPSSSGNAQALGAFKVVGSNNLKYLGSEPSLEKLQKRIEAYTVSLKIRNVLDETISLVNNRNKVHENRPGYGLEM